MMTIRARVALLVITSAPTVKNHGLSQHTENTLRLSITFGKRHMPMFAQQPGTTPWWRSGFCLLLVLLVTGCAARPAGPPAVTFPPEPVSGDGHVIFVASNGWHSSIVIARTDLSPGRIPEAADFPQARYLEFGWGDAEYYPAERATIAMTLRAALVPTPAVVHVAGLGPDPARFFPTSEVIGFQVDDTNFARLIDFIDASFERGGARRAAAMGPGLYATSHFYPATGRFHLNNTCNTWTARALIAAGFGLRAAGTSRAEDLMHQVRALAQTR